LVYLCNLGNPVVMLIFENVRILVNISDVHFKNIMIVNDNSRVVKMTIMTPQHGARPLHSYICQSRY
jgi:hypothetical protein